ncbi:MAG: hypothetical protein A2Z94_02350 [Gallionellales bacterium GWA2_55_18]|nr:MAG: hypothetical protein A2Z94_02350 [Gallionellales bacterium GWA2_55_18]
MDTASRCVLLLKYGACAANRKYFLTTQGSVTMKTKNLLLLLSALIVVPAWAGDVAVAPATAKPTAMQAAPVTETGVVIELKGSAKGTSALVADLEKEAVYKEAVCSSKPAKKPGKTAKITCAKADGALLVFLGKNAPANVHWSISAAATKSLSIAAIRGVTVTCPQICRIMPCPPPNGTSKLCCPVYPYSQTCP